MLKIVSFHYNVLNLKVLFRKICCLIVFDLNVKTYFRLYLFLILFYSLLGVKSVYVS